MLCRPRRGVAACIAVNQVFHARPGHEGAASAAACLVVSTGVAVKALVSNRPECLLADTSQIFGAIARCCTLNALRAIARMHDRLADLQRRASAGDERF